jgi:deazaflavin-dependent oxidoreductase (nitroreductase family)
MASWDPEAFENALIEDMRAHGGTVTMGPLAGDPLLVMTALGARSGQPRRYILSFTRDGADYIVAASKGGDPADPHWLNNLRAHPDVTVEAEARTFEATAAMVSEADRPRLWDAHVAVLPGFAEYPQKAGRVIPMVRLTPVATH